MISVHITQAIKILPICLLICIQSLSEDAKNDNAVEVQRDLVFGETSLTPDEKIQRVMDVYIPRDRIDFPLPAILFLHGNPGNKPYPGDRHHGWQEYASHLSGKGYACFVISWDLRQGADVGFDIIKMAVRHIRDHAKDYDVDPRRIGVIGHSYGARHACTLATADFLSESERVQVGVMLAGGMSYPSHCDADDAPILLVYGNADALFPQAEGIVSNLQRGGVRFKYVEVEDGQHWIPPNLVVDDGLTLMETVAGFFDKHLARKTVPRK